jgi:hypothetical protein
VVGLWFLWKRLTVDANLYKVKLKDFDVEIYERTLGAFAQVNGSVAEPDSIRDAGMVSVAAAGNGCKVLHYAHEYPAALRHLGIISVGAMNQEGSAAFFSNFSILNVDVVAPGDDVLSTFIGSANAYRRLSGASMACPFVAGIAALVWAHYPHEDAETIREPILRGATPIPSQYLLWRHGLVSAYRSLAIARPVATQHGTTVSHDHFSQAKVIGGTFYREKINVPMGATIEDDEPFIDLQTNFTIQRIKPCGSVWYRFTPAVTGLYELDLLSDEPIYAYAASVYEGNCYESMKLLYENANPQNFEFQLFANYFWTVAYRAIYVPSTRVLNVDYLQNDHFGRVLQYEIVLSRSNLITISWAVPNPIAIYQAAGNRSNLQLSNVVLPTVQPVYVYVRGMTPMGWMPFGPPNLIHVER